MDMEIVKFIHRIKLIIQEKPLKAFLNSFVSFAILFMEGGK